MIQADIRVLFTQDAAYHTEPYSPPWRGRDEIVRQWLDRKDEPSQAEFRWHLLAVAPEVVVRESSDQGDDGAPVRVQGEDHGDTPAVKGENVADDGSQREVEGGDHRFPLRLCHRGPPPPIEPAAQDHGRRQDQPGRVVQRLRTSPQGLRQGRGRRRRARLIRGPPARPRRPAAPSRGRNQDIAALFLSIAVVATTLAAAPSRRRGRVARGRAATGQSRWPPADARPARREPDLADRVHRVSEADGFGPSSRLSPIG